MSHRLQAKALAAANSSKGKKKKWSKGKMKEKVRDVYMLACVIAMPVVCQQLAERGCLKAV